VHDIEIYFYKSKRMYRYLVDTADMCVSSKVTAVLEIIN